MSIERLNIDLTTGLLQDGVRVYGPGETVAGNVEVMSSNVVKLEGIIIKCKGDAAVSWTENKSKDPSKEKGTNKTVERTAEISCVDMRMPLISIEGGNKFTLPSGVAHQFPFSFILPENIASSFESNHGHVRYTLSVTLYPEAIEGKVKSNAKKKIISWAKKKSGRAEPSSLPPVKVVIPFNIGNRKVELDSTPQTSLGIIKPAEIQVKISNWLGCISQKESIQAWLNRSAYVPGDTILFITKVNPKRIVLSKDSSLRIIELTEYLAQGGFKKIESRVLTEMTSLRNWEEVPIRLPLDMAPSGSPFCPLINTTYQLLWTLKQGDENRFCTREWSEVSIPLNIVIASASENLNNHQPVASSAPPLIPQAPFHLDETINATAPPKDEIKFTEIA